MHHHRHSGRLYVTCRCSVLRQVRLYATNIDRTTLLESRVNAPTALPPPLVLPGPRQSSEYRVLYAYKLGKSYLTFYKTGFKQILANRKTVKQIRAMHTDDPLVKAIPGTATSRWSGQTIATHESFKHETLSRAEFQLLRRHAKDIKKVPVFAVLLAIFGEWLPLFVIFLDPLIPGTVLLPRQVLKRRRKSARAGDEHVASHRIKGDLEGGGIHDRAQVVAIARRFGLLGFISQFFSTTAILGRVRRHERYLAIDDTLLLRDLKLPIKVSTSAQITRTNVLEPEELELAVEERGLWSEKQSLAERAALLDKWLQTSGPSKGSHEGFTAQEKN